MKPRLLLCLALASSALAGCCSAPGSIRSRMAQVAIAALPKDVQQTEFAYIGDVHTAQGTYYVAVQSLILSDMMAPRGEPARLLLFSDGLRLVAVYQADVTTGARPLWCEGSRVYLAGFSSLHFDDTVNPGIPPSSRLARLFAGTDETPTGNVIDFSRGPRKPMLTREQRYGSSGGLEDDPWKLTRRRNDQATAGGVDLSNIGQFIRKSAYPLSLPKIRQLDQPLSKLKPGMTGEQVGEILAPFLHGISWRTASGPMHDYRFLYDLRPGYNLILVYDMTAHPHEFVRHDKAGNQWLKP